MKGTTEVVETVEVELVEAQLAPVEQQIATLPIADEERANIVAVLRQAYLANQEVGVFFQDAQVRNPTEFTAVEAQMTRAKTESKRVAAVLETEVERANKLHKSLTGLRKFFTTPLDSWEACGKRLLEGYTLEQRRKAEEENRRRQAEAEEKARKEREAIAERERKAREKEEELRRQAAAAANEKERARLERQAAEQVQRQEELRAKQATVVTAPVPVVMAAVPDVKGTSFRETWTAKINDPKAAITHLLTLPDWMAYVKVDEVALNKLGQRTQGQAAVPGVVFTKGLNASKRTF